MSRLLHVLCATVLGAGAPANADTGVAETVARARDYVVEAEISFKAGDALESARLIARAVATLPESDAYHDERLQYTLSAIADYQQVYRASDDAHPIEREALTFLDTYLESVDAEGAEPELADLRALRDELRERANAWREPEPAPHRESTLPPLLPVKMPMEDSPRPWLRGAPTWQKAMFGTSVALTSVFTPLAIGFGMQGRPLASRIEREVVDLPTGNICAEPHISDEVDRLCAQRVVYRNGYRASLSLAIASAAVVVVSTVLMSRSRARRRSARVRLQPVRGLGVTMAF